MSGAAFGSHKADLSRVLQNKYGKGVPQAIIDQVWAIIITHHATAPGIKTLITQIEFLLGDRDRRGFYNQGMPGFADAGLACPLMGVDPSGDQSHEISQRQIFLEFAADAVFADILQQVGTQDPEPMSWMQLDPMGRSYTESLWAVGPGHTREPKP